MIQSVVVKLVFPAEASSGGEFLCGQKGRDFWVDGEWVLGLIKKRVPSCASAKKC